MASEYRFSVPSLPKEIYHKFQEVRKALGMTQKQMLILGVYSVCHLGEIKDAEASNPMMKEGTIDRLLRTVHEKYPSKKDEGI